MHKITYFFKPFFLLRVGTSSQLALDVRDCVTSE
jgi:hypothetical protein